MNADIEKKLLLLLETGALARSECRAGLLAFLKPLLAAGVVEWQRAGAGKRLVLQNAEVLRGFIARQFPHAAGELGATSSRVESLARFRDTKILANDVPEIVCLRGFGQGCLKRDGTAVPLASATKRFGVFSFLLDTPARYEMSGRIALIENPAVFAACEALDLPVDIALFGRGRCSNRLLDWLSSQEETKILHLPDYDPVGLSEHERLRKRLGTRVQLHLPVNLEELFEKYANRSLLFHPRVQAELAELRRASSPAVALVVVLINKHNAALEQESLLIERNIK